MRDVGIVVAGLLGFAMALPAQQGDGDRNPGGPEDGNGSANSAATPTPEPSIPVPNDRPYNLLDNWPPPIPTETGWPAAAAIPVGHVGEPEV